MTVNRTNIFQCKQITRLYVSDLSLTRGHFFEIDAEKITADTLTVNNLTVNQETTRQIHRMWYILLRYHERNTIQIVVLWAVCKVNKIY